MDSLFDSVVSYLPHDVQIKVREYLKRRGASDRAVNEIRLRVHGAVALVIEGKNVPLDVSVSRDAMRESFKRICGGAVFAHRDDMCRGFVSLPGGVRVGVCAEARYQDGAIVGIGEISALVFRIPSGECGFARELYRGWKAQGCGGMLICSAAGEGKTSAIRALARLVGSDDPPRRVVVADERCEFNPTEYERMHVDILRGYKRSLAVEIAIRTLSCEVLMVDEISSRDDSEAMLSAIGAGVTVIATAHARSFSDVMKRECVRSLVLSGLFESVCVISRLDGRFLFSLDRINIPQIDTVRG